MKLTYLSLQRAPRIGRLMQRPPSPEQRVVAYRVERARGEPVEFGNAELTARIQAAQARRYAAEQSAPDEAEMQAAFQFKYDTRSIA